MALNKDDLLKRAPDIATMVPYWDKVSAIVTGLSAMRAAGTDYLPKFKAEEKEDYEVRLGMSKFTNIYRDVLEGLATKPFEEEITLIGGDDKIPEEIKSFVEDVDGSGNNLSMFSALTFFNGINYAIDWIFVDYPTIEQGVVMNRAEAKKRNIKPFWSHVLAKNVLEVRTEIIGSKEVINYIRIHEPDVTGKDGYVREFQKTGDVVSWKLYNISEAIPVVEKEGVLSIPVIPLVPFMTGRRDGKSFKFFPAMQDAADLQITLYQNESALEYIKNLACYPMLAANGMKPTKDAAGNPEKVAIGPMRVLYGVPDGAGGHGTWQYIEPAANSMEFLKKDISATKQDLRELGRQPLTALSTQLTTVTTSIAAGKARSAVTAWALGLKDTLENALVITAMWMKNETYDPEVNVYTGFDNVLDDGSDLEALATARENRDISQQTYLFELKRRKVLSPEFNYQDELKRILNEIPSDDGIDINKTTRETDENT